MVLLTLLGTTQAEPWLRDGRPTPEAHEALRLLDDADGHGLQPHDYDANALRVTLQQLEQAPDNAGAEADDFERALGASLRRYLQDLHAGRVDPATLYPGWRHAASDALDVAAVLDEALAQHRLQAAVDAAEPALPQYQRLREALARYRALQDHPAWAQPLPPLPARLRGTGVAPWEPIDAWDGLPLLVHRLQVLGDLPGDVPMPLRYEGTLVQAVKAFQRRHALEADGVLGRETLAALEVAPTMRARQIALTLERLRWTPLTRAPRMVLVNLPEFVLRAYEVRAGRITLRLEMRVIIGKALDKRTPLLDEEMRAIEFSPYWNVPPSIARGELVPRLRRDPAYWAREGFEFVSAEGSVQAGLTPARLDAVLAGALRIRQRPGPRNALGDIKLVFPNAENIYLHHTPATALFARVRRDFSHGCIRVEQPAELAAFVLEGHPGWDAARIREAMARGQSSTLWLQRPLPVLIAYGTALVKEGRVHFFNDVYGHDRVLDAALRMRPVPAPRQLR